MSALEHKRQEQRWAAVNCETIRVGDVMRTDVATIALEATVADALRSAQRRGIRHLPVMDRGMLVGIISDRDLKRALTGDNREGAGRPVTAADIMTRTVLTVSPNTTVGNACDTMMQEAVSALPVVAGSALIGMITEAEILALFARSELPPRPPRPADEQVLPPPRSARRRATAGRSRPI